MNTKEFTTQEPVYYKFEMDYSGFRRTCELAVLCPIRQIWTLVLPNLQYISGVGSALKHPKFIAHINKYYGLELLDWLMCKFEELFPADDNIQTVIFAVCKDKQQGLICLIPGNEEDSWTLQYPDTSTIIGFNNPYDFLDEEKLKAWEDNYKDKCVNFLRIQFSELYQTKEKSLSDEKR